MKEKKMPCETCGVSLTVVSCGMQVDKKDILSIKKCDHCEAKMSKLPEFTVKDSGKREEFNSGMVRDTAEDKIDYTLALDGPMFERYAVHLTKGAKKYSKRNWMKAQGQAEFDRATESLARHFIQYMRGDTDEDHAAAVIFNINLREYVKGKLLLG